MGSRALVLSRVHTGNIVEATFEFVEATFDFVAKNGNDVEAMFVFIERIVRLVTSDNVASTWLLVWTGLYRVHNVSICCCFSSLFAVDFDLNCDYNLICISKAIVRYQLCNKRA